MAAPELLKSDLACAALVCSVVAALPVGLDDNGFTGRATHHRLSLGFQPMN